MSESSKVTITIDLDSYMTLDEILLRVMQYTSSTVGVKVLGISGEVRE